MKDNLFKAMKWYTFTGSSKIESGCNFFVATLNLYGATTEYSCHGHPNGFYVAFNSSYDTALLIKQAGYFNVEIARNGQWIMRLPKLSKSSPGHRDHILGAASQHWAEFLKLNRIKMKEAIKIMERNGIKKEGRMMPRKEMA